MTSARPFPRIARTPGPHCICITNGDGAILRRGPGCPVHPLYAADGSMNPSPVAPGTPSISTPLHQRGGVDDPQAALDD